MNATELAQKLGVTKARISQYVSEGKLADCYTGEGRNRRFDLDKVQARLTRTLDKGQMLGNGRQTATALKEIAGKVPISPASFAPRPSPDALPPDDLDRYELARIQSAEEDARRKRRDNERDEGRWVLASEVEHQSAAALARELAQVEMMLRESARALADRLGVDYRTARAILMEEWRRFRSRRAAILGSSADDSEMTDAEKAEDA